MARFVVAVVVAAAVAGAAAPSQAAKRRRHPDVLTEGRRHARAGAAWSAQGRCDRAIPEYDAAFSALRDPVILFNRAECLRKIGDDDRAVADYEAYLAGLPAAPNRTQVESRIAELRAKTEAAHAAAAPPAAIPLAPSLPEAPALPPPRVAATPILDAAAPPRADDRSSSGSTWIVVLGAVALAAGGAAAWWLARRDPTDVPPSTLGGYRF